MMKHKLFKYIYNVGKKSYLCSYIMYVKAWRRVQPPANKNQT